MLKRKSMKTWLLSICLILISITNSQASTAIKPMPSITAFKLLIDDLEKRFPSSPNNPLIVVSASEQRLFYIKDNQVQESHIISTAEAGLGSQSGSYKTPLGVHRVAKKFGKNAKLGTIFKSRMNTRRVARILSDPDARSKDDNVTSRILWLSGLEKGLNKGGNVDSFKRYIYIHGTDEEGRLGTPASHGCIRMSNKAVIELFDKVPIGTIVYIVE